MTDKKTIKLTGIAITGLGEAPLFTQVPWVKDQFINKLGIDPYPGTFNLKVIAEDRDKLNIIRQAKGIEITPEDKNYCSAMSLPVRVGGKIKGATVTPLVPSYPPDQLEIISSENIKQSLALKDGDLVKVEVYI